MRALVVLAACTGSATTIANRAAPPLPPPTTSICTVRASLDTGGIRHTIRSYQTALATCYAQYGIGEQRVQATFTIGADGHVTQAEVGGAAHELDACVCNVVATFAFPALWPGAKSVVVTYPFVFTPTE